MDIIADMSLKIGLKIEFENIDVGWTLRKGGRITGYIR